MGIDWRAALAWIAGWALGGAAIAFAVAFAADVLDFGPLLVQSVALAEVLGVSILASTRGLFRYFGHLPDTVRLVAQGVTLFTATLLGSIVVFFLQPLFFVANPRLMGTLVLANAVLAVVVGTTLHAYDRMKRQLERSFALLAEKEALERELSLAREVQQQLLPRAAPAIPGIEVEGTCIPAIGVGGDLFDWFEPDDTRLVLAIADVSGKGIAAALHGASLHSALRGAAGPDFSPAAAADRLNTWLYGTSDHARYATLFLASLDAARGELRYVCGGHPPGLLLRNGRIERLCERGRPVGLLDDSTYVETAVPLRSGDLLALCTDGVLEAPGRDGEEFGEDRLAALLVRHGALSLDGLRETILEEVAAWTGDGPAHDDLTLVLARVR